MYVHIHYMCVGICCTSEYESTYIVSYSHVYIALREATMYYEYIIYGQTLSAYALVAAHRHYSVEYI